MKATEGGMNFIELLIVIAIVGILAVVALPAYQNYSVRTKVAEGLTLATIAKNAVAETFTSKSAVPNQASTGYISPGPNATTNVDNITIANDGTGIITIVFTATAGGGTITYSPTLSIGSTIAWNCKGGTLLSKYRPPVCR